MLTSSAVAMASILLTAGSWPVTEASSSVETSRHQPVQVVDTILPNLPPTSGQIHLDAGFLPDPYDVSVNAGGDVSVQSLGLACRGAVTVAPTFRLSYQRARRSPRLLINAWAESDLVIVAQTPDGSISCSETEWDGEEAYAQLYFRQPQSGDYVIWVGGPRQDATLSFTEEEDY